MGNMFGGKSSPKASSGSSRYTIHNFDPNGNI